MDIGTELIFLKCSFLDPSGLHCMFSKQLNQLSMYEVLAQERRHRESTFALWRVTACGCYTRDGARQVGTLPPSVALHPQVGVQPPCKQCGHLAVAQLCLNPLDYCPYAAVWFLLQPPQFKGEGVQ